MSEMKAYDPNRPLVSVDSETALFSNGNMAPLASCWSFAWRDGDDVATELLNHSEGAREVMRLLTEAIAGRLTLTLQNGPYDFAVLCAEYPEALPLVFDAHEAGAIHDTMAAEWIIDTANGLLRMSMNEDTGEMKSNKSYGLENLTRIHLGWPPYKDEWRMRYGELRDVNPKDYPEAARVYPMKDAKGTLLVTEIQREIARGIGPHDPLVASLAHVCRTYMALQLVSCWGQEIDAADAHGLERCMSEYSASFVEDLENAGLVHRVQKGKKAGSLTKKKAPLVEMVARALIESGHTSAFPDLTFEGLMSDPMTYLDEDYLTDGGKSGNRQIKCSGSVLTELANFTGYQDRALAALIKTQAEYIEAEKLRSSFGVPLRSFGYGPIHSRYGYTETGRTTASGGPKRARTGLNVQQLPRKLPKKLIKLILELLGRSVDVRSCIATRAGWVMSSTDYSALEACTFAQASKWLVGYSVLGDAINSGTDPHTLFATGLLHCSYEEAAARVLAEDPVATMARQRAKVGNFGFPSGMGWRKFLKYALAQGVVMTPEESQLLHRLYRQRWPETLDYFALAAAALEHGSTKIIGLVSGMVRGGVNYTGWCNGNFQEHAAFGATSAAWRIVRECYDARLNTELYGSRVTAFVHDEFIAEHPEDRGHEASERLALVAIEEMQAINPDVKISAEPALMSRWYKGAKTVRDEHGRLQKWEPKPAEKSAS